MSWNSCEAPCQFLFGENEEVLLSRSCQLEKQGDMACIDRLKYLPHKQ